MSSTLSVRKVMVVAFATTAVLIALLTAVTPAQAHEGRSEASSSQSSHGKAAARRMPADVYHVPKRLINSLEGRCADKYSGRKERLCKKAQHARAHMATMVITRKRAKHFYHAYKHNYNLAAWCENHGSLCSAKYASATHGCAGQSTNSDRVDCWRQKGSMQYYKYNLIAGYANAPIPSKAVRTLLKAVNMFKAPQPDSSTRHVSHHWSWLGGEYIQVLFSRSDTTSLYQRAYFSDNVQTAASIICLGAGIPWVIAACEVAVGVLIADARHDLKEAATTAGKCFQLKEFVMISPIGAIRNLNLTSVESCQ